MAQKKLETDLIQMLQSLSSPPTEGEKRTLSNLLNKYVTLSLHSNKILKKQHLKNLFNALENNHTITALDLSYCKIPSRDILHLANALIHNDTLTYLNLIENPILTKDVARFISILHANTKLTHLKFHCLGAKGAPLLYETLQKNKTLTKLTLSPFCDVHCIAQLIKVNKTLTSIDLGDFVKEADLAILAKTIHSIVDGPIKHPSLFVNSKGEIYTSPLLQTAFEIHTKQIATKAYTIAKQLNAHLHQDEASIVAEYLDLEKTCFKAGSQNKAMPPLYSVPLLTSIAPLFKSRLTFSKNAFILTTLALLILCVLIPNVLYLGVGVLLITTLVMLKKSPPQSYTPPKTQEIVTTYSKPTATIESQSLIKPIPIMREMPCKIYSNDPDLCSRDLRLPPP